VITALAAYAWLAWQDPAWRLLQGFFWSIRDVLTQFYIGYFLLGVLGARLLPQLRRLRARAAPLCLVAALLAIAGFAWLAAGQKLAMWAPLTRAGYLLGVIALIATLVPRGVAPGPVRFLSEATLTIYLYHQMIYPTLLPQLRAALPPGLAVVVMAACGLALGVAIAWAGRRLLGARGRVLIGT
jgi:peptidoglycan/LPS O-acetylase OafA/YrhL